MDCSPPGFSVHGILQARILEWVAMPFSRGSSRPRDWTQVSRIADRFFTVWATQEAPETKVIVKKKKKKKIKIKTSKQQPRSFWKVLWLIPKLILLTIGEKCNSLCHPSLELCSCGRLQALGVDGFPFLRKTKQKNLPRLEHKSSV